MAFLRMLPAILGFALLSTSIRADVSGKILDQDGLPVGGLTVRFTPQGHPDKALTVTARKKGSFFKRGLARGPHTIDLVDSDLFITSVEFQLKNNAGLVVGQGRLEGHPLNGVEGVPISNINEMQLELTVAAKDSEEASRRKLAFALPALAAASTLFNDGRYEEAVVETDRLLAEAPDLGEAHYVRGVALEKLDRLADAETALLQAVRSIPDYPRIWAALSEVTMKLAEQQESNGAVDESVGTYGRAAEALQAAIEREPESMPLQTNLAAALDRAGSTEALLPVLQQILDRDASNLQIRLRLAGLLSAGGDQKRAVALLDEIPATEKRAAITIYNVAVRLNEGGDSEASLLMARKSSQIDPALSHPRRLMAQILLAQGDHPGAIEAIQAFLELAPEDPEAETYRRILGQLQEE